MHKIKRVNEPKGEFTKALTMMIVLDKKKTLISQLFIVARRRRSLRERNESLELATSLTPKYSAVQVEPTPNVSVLKSFCTR